MATAGRLQTTVLPVSAKVLSKSAIAPALEGAASPWMVPVEMLGKAPMLDTCAGLASAAASMVIVVLLRITASLPGAVKQLLVVVRVRSFCDLIVLSITRSFFDPTATKRASGMRWLAM